MSTAPAKDVEAEVTRLHLRYAREVVEALGFCPWATEAREQGRVQVCVVRGTNPPLTAALGALDRVIAREASEVGFVVFPEIALERLAFSHFVAEVRAADAARFPLGEAPLAMADFHPNAAADTASPERLVPFVRRSPMPTIQLVRRSALDAVRLSDSHGTSFFDPARVSLAELLDAAAPTPALAQRVAKQNLRTVQKLGLDHVEAIFRDIARDRDATYAALEIAQPAWANAHQTDDDAR